MQEEKPAAARKDAHLDLALDPSTRSGGENGFDRISFIHCALPEVSLSAVDLSTEFLGYQLKAPLMIGAMTGGTERAEKINHALADVAEAQSIALAVGSQRAALEAGQTARRLRDLAPHIPIIGNLGGVQLAQSGGLDLARAAIDDLHARMGRDSLQSGRMFKRRHRPEDDPTRQRASLENLDDDGT